MSFEKSVFIASSGFDAPTVEPVARIIEETGRRVIRFDGNLVSNLGKRLVIAVNSDTTSLDYGVDRIVPDQIGSAWYRRPNNVSMDGLEPLQEAQVVGNIRHLFDGVWSRIDEDRWLNAPGNMASAEDKLDQLTLASRLGLEIPKTVVTNSRFDLISAFPCGDVIFKLPRGIISIDGTPRSIPTQVFSREKIDEIVNQRKRLFPGIYQERIDKAKEWRVTVVGEKVFSAAIYTDETAKDDWRIHQATDAVTFNSEELDESVAEKLVEICRHYKLRYGAFDLIETPEGRLVFLELNPNGQYQWLVDRLGVDIPRAIAEELIKISNS